MKGPSFSPGPAKPWGTADCGQLALGQGMAPGCLDTDTRVAAVG